VAARILSVLGGLAAAAMATVVLAAFGSFALPVQAAVWAETYFLLMFLVVIGVLRHLRKRIERILHEAEEAARDLGVLAGVLRRLEAERFAAERLVTLRTAFDTAGHPPSERIARLNRLMDRVDSRHNMFVGTAGVMLLRDIHLCYALEDWRSDSGPALRRWLRTVGEVEALTCLACLRYERPGYVFPEFVADSPCFDGEALGHPLLKQEAAVTNDVRIDGNLQVLVVSGSNMSGKSTLLRTVGINVVLAQAGAPVHARRLRLSPLAAGASIRILDSLQEGTSRFYAEITRLRQIMEKTSGALPVLFLIDEFLHGTNSHDRRIGAEAIVRRLVERGAIGLITTHDLALAHIADALDPRAANVHFEDHLEDGRMRFDYQMRPGIVRKSNAIELMRSVGLEV
jgi:hypothetical protein